MSDSDSDSDSGVLGSTRAPLDIFNRWYDIPVDKKREAVQRMKICSFWLPILLQRDECGTVRWAIEMGLISANENNDINLKHIRRIEIVETIFRALERGFVSEICQSDTDKISLAEVLDDAFRWLLRTGEPDIQKQMTDASSMDLMLFKKKKKKFLPVFECISLLPVEINIFLPQKSEEMKKKGNEHFEKQHYEEAVKYYSKAIEYYPDNHKLYGNRALSFIRCKKYLCCDEEIIFLVFVQGHYRYCEALFSLGHYEMAIKANKFAQMLCKDDHEGVKDLETQFCKYTTTHPMPLSKSEKGESNATAKKKSKSKTSHPGKQVSFSHLALLQSHQQYRYIKWPSSVQSQVVVDGKADRLKEFRSLVEDAHTAMADLRTRNAEQAFSRALTLLETVTTKVILVLTELTGAEKLLEKIKSYDERTFQCLVYYAFGKLYLRENRFAVALEQFLDSLQMVKNQITPGKLTWPLTKEIVKETQPDCFKEILEDAIELCKFPPLPDAICRLDKCLCPVKAEIYFTDPDFKGFIRICCCEDCTVEYHVTCWKTLKASAFSEKSEKDLLQEACLTPDCIGQICSITIFCPTGVVKCKVRGEIPKPQTVKKPKVNQKCTSLKKLKSKEEHKLRRKQHKVSFQDNEDKQILQQQQDSAAPSQQKGASCMYRDRVLLQINQNVELLRGENGLHISVLFSSLKPWLELDFARGNQLAGRMLNWQQEQLETLGQVAELLLERNNRVWARVFIQELSSCVNINPKLSNWAHRLNDGGLNAAQSFIERYAGRLEQLDLSLLLKFGPLQDMIIEKLGTSPELFSSIGLTVTEYLKQAPPHDMRLFIWTMDEHRDEYVSCHTILDEYFDMLDGHCSVLKKSDESQNNSPIKAKSRGRKKKQKEPKGVIVLSGMRSVNPRDEWDQEFFEDDSLSFLDTLDSFTVPSHLRDQVAEFEDQYDSRRHRSHYKHILDNNPDSTKESLYDYFAQILDEHGPLVAEDPLLVGELENFPSEAKRKIEAAGGFEPFLLDSLRFIKIGRCIGLAKHAVSLQQAERGTEGYTVLPNPYASGFQPLYQPVIGSYFAWSNGDDQEPDNNFSPNGYEDLYLDPSEFNRGVWETNREDVVLLQEEVQKITANIQVTNKELTLFQQKLEDEVKKDQKEKKANQEALRSLKQEIEELLEQQGSLVCAALIGLGERLAGPDCACRLQLNMEDPCIICHDEMSPDDTCVLECRHSFHNECIRSWLKEQSTCPTCRTHALLPEDFPMLTGRRRPAP
uniref:Tetratricopeptide repeat domain 3 n=1 Tax=Pundamilia nyererei TaxID=303518 RepID=A0A3B4FQ11_9CICH